MSRDIDSQLVKYLRDAHAMEQQSIKLLQKAEKIAGNLELEQLLHGHLSDSEEHARYVKERLQALGERPSTLQDAAQKGTAFALGAVVQAMPDTPAKLMAVAFAFESFEIAAYTMLRDIAERADDADTVAMCDRILPVERQAAELIAAKFPVAVDAALGQLGVEG